MGVIPLLIVCSVVAAGSFLIAFLWATATGQFDDIQTPALRILFPDRTADRSKVRQGPNELMTSHDIPESLNQKPYHEH